MKIAIACFLLVASFISCNTKHEKTLFELAENTGINFRNDVEDGKVDNSFLFRNFYNGGGVAAGDINNDGLPDLFFTSNTGENKLYLNKGNFTFEDITAKARIVKDDKWYTGVTFADVNNDGWLDIYVCSSGHMSTGNRKNKLYINDQHLGFTEAAAQYGLDISGYCTQVSFFDYDMDGDLDCFLINNSPIPVNQLGFSQNRNLPEKEWAVGEFLKGGGDHLYKNDNGRFTEVTQSAGIHGGLMSFGLGVSVGDINGDDYPDVYIANDSYERDYLYINQRNGTFKDELEERISHVSMSSMGADIADINNDGYPDIFTTDMLADDDYRLKTTGAFDNIDLYRTKEKAGLYRQFVKNCLQLNDRNGKFIEMANYAGVSASDWSWGALFFDADNDGFNDIYVCNGVNRDVIDLDFMDFFANEVMQKMVLTGKKENVDEVLKKIPRTPLLNKAYRNKGNLQFEDIGASWGFSQATFSNGAAYVDLDNDGDLDLVVNNENQPASVYRNNARELTKNNYVSVSLTYQEKNKFAIGSKVTVFAGGQIFCREVIPSRGFQSSVDYKQVIGLGAIAKIDSMIITWPDRSKQKINSPAINTMHSITYGSDREQPRVFADVVSQPLFDSVPSNFEKHQEDDHTDFYFERNLPELLSRLGPKAACGDVNGDKLMDLYIGGTPGHVGQLYLQTNKGGFEKKPQPGFNQFIEFEDVTTLLLDVDNDKDLDLIVGPGGNSNDSNSRNMQTRLLKNDGKGNFALDAAAFPPNGTNTGTIVANDFNHDGYVDLFLGGRSMPFLYGVSPPSFLYLNDGQGHFKDVTKTMAPAISRIGMVSGAVWADVYGDANKELIITGEWMATHIFYYNNDHFEELPSNLNDLSGWWQTVAAADLNGDGKQDLVLGNIGQNFYLHPDSSHPVKLWLRDFDQNNSPDRILTYTVNGKDMPVFLKKDMEDQIPSLKKQNLRHSSFAKKSMQELFSNDILKNAVVKTFNYTASCIAYNEGNGKFRIEPLPPMVQLSSVNSILCEDITGDGLPDLVLGGNNFGFPPQFGRLDGSRGHVLINQGKEKFRWLYANQSGLSLEGEVRDIVNILRPDGHFILFLQNNEYPALYKLKK